MNLYVLSLSFLLFLVGGIHRIGLSILSDLILYDKFNNGFNKKSIYTFFYVIFWLSDIINYFFFHFEPTTTYISIEDQIYIIAFNSVSDINWLNQFPILTSYLFNHPSNLPTYQTTHTPKYLHPLIYIINTPNN